MNPVDDTFNGKRQAQLAQEEIVGKQKDWAAILEDHIARDHSSQPLFIDELRGLEEKFGSTSFATPRSWTFVSELLADRRVDDSDDWTVLLDEASTRWPIKTVKEEPFLEECQEGGEFRLTSEAEDREEGFMLLGEARELLSAAENRFMFGDEALTDSIRYLMGEINSVIMAHRNPDNVAE